MKPEEKARQNIDRLLESAGWTVQDISELNLGASLGVAIREFPLKSGPVDYLFLVDRNNLGRQTRREFEQYITPDDGRKFSELYNVQHLTSNTLDPVSRVCITTIQRLYSMLRGEPEFDDEIEELNEVLVV